MFSDPVTQEMKLFTMQLFILTLSTYGFGSREGTRLTRNSFLEVLLARSGLYDYENHSNIGSSW
jgi:hypothetical protein